MAAQLLEVERLSKRFGGFVALDDINLAVTAGERVGLIGPNGSGKSTLVNCLCGTLVNEAGAVRFEGRNLAGQSAHQRTRLGMARSFQLPRPFALSLDRGQCLGSGSWLKRHDCAISARGQGAVLPRSRCAGTAARAAGRTR